MQRSTLSIASILLLCIVSYVAAARYSNSYSSPASRRRQAAYRSAAPTARYADEENYPAVPHSFNYDVTDEYGNRRFHNEEGDGQGASRVVRGSYGYVDSYGVYRTVNYIADANGYRAEVDSNEPGLDYPASADVKLTLKSPPASVYQGSSNKKTKNYQRDSYRA